MLGILRTCKSSKELCANPWYVKLIISKYHKSKYIFLKDEIIYLSRDVSVACLLVQFARDIYQLSTRSVSLISSYNLNGYRDEFGCAVSMIAGEIMNQPVLPDCCPNTNCQPDMVQKVQSYFRQTIQQVASI